MIRSSRCVFASLTRVRVNAAHASATTLCTASQLWASFRIGSVACEASSSWLDLRDNHMHTCDGPVHMHNACVNIISPRYSRPMHNSIIIINVVCTSTSPVPSRCRDAIGNGGAERLGLASAIIIIRCVALRCVAAAANRCVRYQWHFQCKYARLTPSERTLWWSARWQIVPTNILLSHRLR